LEKLDEIKNKLQNKIENGKNKLVGNKNKCLEYRLVKTYKSSAELESHNEIPIRIDNDKLIINEGTNMVQPGQYALLEENPNNLKIFKREKLANDKEMWIYQPNINIDYVMKTNKDFCEQQLKNLEDVESSMFNARSCKFSEVENSCMTSGLDKKIQKMVSIENKIKELEDILSEIRLNIDYKGNLDKDIEKYQNYMLLANEISLKKYKNIEKEEELIEDFDPKYEQLYKKINLYLEKISKFSDQKKYTLLESLIEKYGRAYNPSASNENPNNIYCKYGNKIICCKHDTHIIELFKNIDDQDNYETQMDILIDYFAIEDNGKNWCKNCGREIYIAEYETLEGFKKSGARDVTNEVLEEETYTSQYENLELFESLKKYLDEDTNNSDSIAIINVLKAILNITGIKLNDKDEMKIITESANNCKTNIKSKTLWLQTYKGKPNKAIKNYQT
ncbi:MAG: hypothetical protein VXW53_02170, partial [Verrucomicrobiota bacterium]|nr:hypothetical protein [Verrucomicrobiota bacterium]